MSKWPDVDRWQKEADYKNCVVIFMMFYAPLLLLLLAIWVFGYCEKA